MTSLSERFRQDWPTLLDKIHSAPTLKEGVGILHDYLSSLTDLNKDYISSLTRGQARVSLAVLSLYRDHFKRLMGVFSRLEALLESQRSSSSSGEPAAGSQPTQFLGTDTLAGIGVAGLIGVVVAESLVVFPLAIGGGIIASKLVHSIEHKRPASSQPIAAQKPMKPVASGDGDTLAHLYSEQLGELFETVDTLVEEHGRLEDAARPQPSERKLEDHPRVLAFLQDLIGWFERQKGELSGALAEALRLRIEEQLPGLLSEYSIQVRQYDPRSGERDLALFDHEEEAGAPRLSGPVTAQPALLKKGKVLLRGRVLEPRRSPGSNSN